MRQLSPAAFLKGRCIIREMFREMHLYVEVLQNRLNNLIQLSKIYLNCRRKIINTNKKNINT